MNFGEGAIETDADIRELEVFQLMGYFRGNQSSVGWFRGIALRSVAESTSSRSYTSRAGARTIFSAGNRAREGSEVYDVNVDFILYGKALSFIGEHCRFDFPPMSTLPVAGPRLPFSEGHQGECNRDCGPVASGGRNSSMACRACRC